jgi:hypothetical protein
MLKDWAPIALNNLYESVSVKDDLSTQALFRLGNNEEMASVWDKLLSKPINGWRVEETNKSDLEQALVVSLWSCIQKSFNNPNDEIPSVKNKTLKKIKTKIDELIALLDGEESKCLMNTYLHSQNKVYRATLGEVLGNNDSRNSIAQLPFNLESEIRGVMPRHKDGSLADDGFQWVDKPHKMRLAWWAKESSETSLESLLKFYKSRLDHIGKTYSDGYWSAQKASIIKGVRGLMNDLYGEPLLNETATICSVILNDSLDKYDVSEGGRKK